MSRLLFALSIMFLVSKLIFSRDEPKPAELLVFVPRQLEAGTTPIRVYTRNQSPQELYVRGCAGQAWVIVERYLGGRWIEHRRFGRDCTIRQSYALLHRGARSRAMVELLMPGRYRILMVYGRAYDRLSKLAISNEFFVTPPRFSTEQQARFFGPPPSRRSAALAGASGSPPSSR